MARDKGTTIMYAILFAVIGLYLFSEFFAVTDGSISFATDPDAAGAAFMVLKILILGGVAIGSIFLAGKFSKPLSKADYASIIIIMVAAYFLWEYVLSGIINAGSFDDLTFAVGMKLGLLP